MAELTKNAYKILCIAYKQYLERTETMKENDARFIHADFYQNEKAVKNLSSRDIFTYVRELQKSGFCKSFQDGSFKLTSEAIAHMENRFKNGLKDVVDVITKFL